MVVRGDGRAPESSLLYSRQRRRDLRPPSVGDNRDMGDSGCSQRKTKPRAPYFQLGVPHFICRTTHRLRPAGQRAEIKVDTFNFTRYGLLHGKVVSVSQDSDRQRKAPGQVARHVRRRRILERAAGPGTELCGPHLARPHPDASRRRPRQPDTWHGGDRRDQDRNTPYYQLPVLALAAIRPRQPARAVRTRLPRRRRAASSSATRAGEQA